jgi:hypothetical protein
MLGKKQSEGRKYFHWIAIRPLKWGLDLLGKANDERWFSGSKL